MKTPKIVDLVFIALMDNPKARGDDFILYNEVLKNFIAEDMTLSTVLKHHVELRLPSFASIDRARRKLQKEHKELRPSESIRKIRKEEEQAYRAFAKGLEQ